jgi:hypothetical protein
MSLKENCICFKFDKKNARGVEDFFFDLFIKIFYLISLAYICNILAN